MVTRVHSAWSSGRSQALLSVVAASLLVAMALESPIGAQASGATVTIFHNFFPSPVTIYAGQTVTWVNKDIVLHWVIAERNTFPASGPIAPGHSYRVVFRTIGTYPYQDEYGNRFGTVIVTAAPAATPTPKPTPRPTPRPTPKATTRPAATAKATPKPTKTPVAKPSATTAAVASGSPGESQPPAAGGGTTGGTGGSAGSGGPGSTTPGSSSDGGGGLGLILLVVGLIGAAFAGGIWFASRRGAADPVPLVAGVAPAASMPPAPMPPLAAVGAGATSVAGAATVATTSRSKTGTRSNGKPIQMPGDVVDDEPIQSARPAGPDEGNEPAGD